MHLSLPEGVYRELKKIASDMGIQVTDLIKTYIKLGLTGELSGKTSSTTLSAATSKLLYIEGKLYILTNLLNELQEKIENLERRVDELESPDIMLDIKRRKGRINKP